eukprot:5023022-Prymnesium_polylepis.2
MPAAAILFVVRLSASHVHGAGSAPPLFVRRGVVVRREADIPLRGRVSRVSYRSTQPPETKKRNPDPCTSVHRPAL